MFIYWSIKGNRGAFTDTQAWSDVLCTHSGKTESPGSRILFIWRQTMTMQPWLHLALYQETWVRPEMVGNLGPGKAVMSMDLSKSRLDKGLFVACLQCAEAFLQPCPSLLIGQEALEALPLATDWWTDPRQGGDGFHLGCSPSYCSTSQQLPLPPAGCGAFPLESHHFIFSKFILFW